MSKNTIRINITNNLLERAGRAKNRFPCGATLRHGQGRVEVAYRTWEDHYEIWGKDGEWLASFTDASLPGKANFENLQTAENVQVVFEALSPEANRALTQDRITVEIVEVDGPARLVANVIIRGSEVGFSIDVENQVWGAFPDDNRVGWEAAVEAARWGDPNSPEVEERLTALLLEKCPTFFDDAGE